MTVTFSVWISMLLFMTAPASNNAPACTPYETAHQKFQENLLEIYKEAGLAEHHLDYEAFRYAVIGYFNLKEEGALSEKPLITIIDFNKPSTEKRFYTIDLEERKLVYYTYVAHGKNSGELYATEFSNNVGSLQSSLGFVITAETYIGSKGYSLRLDGTEEDYNSKVRERAVVMHGSNYVNEDFIKQQGRLGRSWGCPALPSHLNKQIIDTIKEGTVIFTFYKDDNYFAHNKIIQENQAVEAFFGFQT